MAALLAGIGTPPSGSSMPHPQKFIYNINDNGMEHFNHRLTSKPIV